eukprot:5472623-Amphidinium_carterae.2
MSSCKPPITIRSLCVNCGVQGEMYWHMTATQNLLCSCQWCVTWLLGRISGAFEVSACGVLVSWAWNWFAVRHHQPH